MWVQTNLVIKVVQCTRRDSASLPTCSEQFLWEQTDIVMNVVQCVMDDSASLSICSEQFVVY